MSQAALTHRYNDLGNEERAEWAKKAHVQIATASEAPNDKITEQAEQEPGLEPEGQSAEAPPTWPAPRMKPSDVEDCVGRQVAVWWLLGGMLWINVSCLSKKNQNTVGGGGGGQVAEGGTMRSF
jgi:hypothetical protein